MDDRMLDRRLVALDPAGPPPAALEETIDAVAARPRPRGRRRAGVALTVGAAVVIAGGVAASTDMQSYLLSQPPFQTLDRGTWRTNASLPVGPMDDAGGEPRCDMFLEFAGTDAEQRAALEDYWAHADPDAFAAGVVERLSKVSPARGEGGAQVDQLLHDLDPVVPGIVWGSSAGDVPRLHGFAVSCVDPR